MCSDHDDQMLAHTLELARHGEGRVEPNPQVGAVIVQAGELIATGFHSRYGALHAETEALSAAGHAARGATLYCNLEPCSYRAPGKHQPPCTEMIIAAGISRVVVGQLDPNPAVSGNGVRALRAAGLTVDVAADPVPFLHRNEVFNTVMALRRPLVHLKWASSLDGRIATAGGDSKWITDVAARDAAHRLRAERDAVLVGHGTVVADDPLLSVRLEAGKEGADGAPGAAQPRPVVLAARGDIDPECRLVRERGPELILCVAAGLDRDRVRPLEDRGVTILEASATDTLHPAGVLQTLLAVGIRSILVEGGARVLTSFLRDGLWDRVTTFVAPIVLGQGREAVGDLALERVSEALRFEAIRWTTIGDQQQFDGYRAGWRQDVTVAGGDVRSPGEG